PGPRGGGGPGRPDPRRPGGLRRPSAGGPDPHRPLNRAASCARGTPPPPDTCRTHLPHLSILDRFPSWFDGGRGDGTTGGARAPRRAGGAAGRLGGRTGRAGAAVGERPGGPRSAVRPPAPVAAAGRGP